MTDIFNSYIGKSIIIGITRMDSSGNVTKQIQMHGIVEESTAQGIKVKLSSGSYYKLPPDADAIQKAPPGEYRFRSTGEVIVDPNLMTSWTIHEPETTSYDFSEEE